MGFLCCLDNSTSNFTPNFQMSFSILENAQIVEQERVKGQVSRSVIYPVGTPTLNQRWFLVEFAN